MSGACKLVQTPLQKLKPYWVEFTDTKGVLRCLRTNEDPARAQGIVFSCPRCQHNKKKAHMCIFLFETAVEGARPPGRFVPSFGEGRLPHPFNQLSLMMVSQDGIIKTNWLKPGDLICRWEGSLHAGIVSWRPNFIERWMRK